MGSVYGPNMVTDNLRLYLDAGNVQSWPGSGTTWYDLAKGGCSNGSMNGIVYSSTGGGSFDFDHTSTDRVNVTLDKSYHNLDLTVDVWAYYDADINAMLWCFHATGAGPDLFFYASSAAGISLNTWDGSSNTFASTPSTSSLVGLWKHYVVVWDYNVNCKLYINGAFVGNATYKTPNTSGLLSVGSNFGAGTYSWAGLMASFKLYDRALTAAEVLQNYNAHKSRFGL